MIDIKVDDDTLRKAIFAFQSIENIKNTISSAYTGLSEEPTSGTDFYNICDFYYDIYKKITNSYEGHDSKEIQDLEDTLKNPTIDIEVKLIKLKYFVKEI